VVGFRRSIIYRARRRRRARALSLLRVENARQITSEDYLGCYSKIGFRV
jgi:hypothetical protein